MDVDLADSESGGARLWRRREVRGVLQGFKSLVLLPPVGISCEVIVDTRSYRSFSFSETHDRCSWAPLSLMQESSAAHPPQGIPRRRFMNYAETS